MTNMRSAQPALRRLAALISTIDTVTKLLRSGKTVVLLSLDFSKAFDRIRHAQGKAYMYPSLQEQKERSVTDGLWCICEKQTH